MSGSDMMNNSKIEEFVLSDRVDVVHGDMFHAKTDQISCFVILGAAEAASMILPSPKVVSEGSLRPHGRKN